jgi:rubrerythrin
VDWQRRYGASAPAWRSYERANVPLRLAIEREIEAFNLYADAAKGVGNTVLRKALEEMSEQERGHRVKLEAVLAGNVRWAVRMAKAQPVTDLRLSDHLVGGSVEPNAAYQDILLFAAKREKAAYDFYTTMAGLLDDVLVQNVFTMLANEELKHKNRLEKMYEDEVYQEF